MTTEKLWKREDAKAAGIPDSSMVDGTDHPSIRMISWDTPPGVRQLLGAKWGYAQYHVKPQSILIAPIGNLWEKDCWWRLQDCLLETAKAGYSVSVHEVVDSNLLSVEAIAMMRWQASMLARDGGVEWLLMVDNDAQLEKDTLLRLLAHDKPIVFPLLHDLEQKFPKEIATLSDPVLEAGHGLRRVRWAAMSVMLFDVRVFNVLDPTAWRGNDFLFSQALHHLGHRIYVDTDTAVRVVKGPGREGSYTFDEVLDGRRRLWRRLRLERRDRRPPPNFNPLKDDGWVDKSGTYFGVVNKVARPASVAATKEKIWVP